MPGAGIDGLPDVTVVGSVGATLGVIAALVAIASASVAVARWLAGRRPRLEVTVALAIRPGGSLIAMVTARNRGRRAVVLTGLGAARCHTEGGKPRPLTERYDTAGLPRRLELDDIHTASIEIAALPPNLAGLAPAERSLPQHFYGAATITANAVPVFSGKPLTARDERPGSPTAGEIVYP